MRRTKIICTIGPSSQDEDMLRKIILAGMNVARFNFSHGDYEEHGLKLERTRKISRELNLPVAVLLDTRGPEIRLRDFAEGKVELKAGQKFTLTTEEIMGTAERATITYKNLPQDVKPGDSILLDDGLIGLKVEEVQGDTEIVCTVMNDGPISNHKGVNVPGVKLNLPFIDEKDHADIVYACEKGFDFIAASFVRSKEDVLQIREILKDLGAEILSMKEAGVDVDIVEDGDTFAANALIKAKAVWEKTGGIVLADDSGLVIDALNGEPGVYSARYMGEKTSYEIKNWNLIHRLDGVPEEKRTARFVCVIAAVLPDGRTLTAEGTMEGMIAHEPAGAGGFGYDPILMLPEYGKTSAEITMDEKNAISHRGKALRAMKKCLAEEIGE